MSIEVRTQAELDKALKDPAVARGDVVIEVKGSGTFVVRGSSSPRMVARESSSPSMVARGSSSPSMVARGSSSPRMVARESSSPRMEAWESSSPRMEARESSSPSMVARGSSSPSMVAWESSSPRMVARESSSPRMVARGSSSPSMVARGSSSPSMVAWGSSSPRMEAWESSSPRMVAWESSSPSMVAWGSSSPSMVAWESSSPRMVAWESSSPRMVAWGSSSPSMEARESSSVTGKIGTYSQPRFWRHDTAKINVPGAVVLEAPVIDTAAKWCDFYGVEIRKGGNLSKELKGQDIAVLFKAVGDRSRTGTATSGTEYRSPHGIEYVPGTSPAAPDWDGGKVECGGGLHFSPHPRMAREFNRDAEHFIACPVLLSEIVVHPEGMYPQKVKAPRVAAACWEVTVDGERVES